MQNVDEIDYRGGTIFAHATPWSQLYERENEGLGQAILLRLRNAMQGL